MKESKFEFRIGSGEVLERQHFGAFELVKTRRGIMFKTYTGFHVWTTPYAAGLDGKARQKSLYAWLDNLIEAKKAYEGHEGEAFGDSGRTKGEVLEAMVIMTEANLAAPLTAFVDEERASGFALEYMAWLNGMQERLAEAMSAPAPAEDPKADAEEGDGASLMGEAAQLAEAVQEGGVGYGNEDKV